MPEFQKNIKIVVDTVVGKATDVKSLTGSFKELGAQVAATQGGFAKMKTAATGALDVLTSTKGGGLAIATAALAFDKIALGLADNFSKLGVEIGKFSDATGLTAEQSSRYVEVAKDLGVGTDALESAFGRLNKNIAATPEKFAALGITAKDSSGRFLEAIHVLHNTRDATEQARLGSELFGKGWQNLAELVGQGAGEIQTRLKGVQDSKIFDDAKIEQARKYRDQLDQISDVVDGLKNTFGALVAGGIGPTIEALGALGAQVDRLASVAGGGGGLLAKVVGNLPGIGSLSGLSTALGDNVDNVDRLKGAVTAILPPLKLLPGGLFDTETAAEKAARQQKELTEAVEKGRAAGQTSLRAYDDLGASFTEAATATTDLADAEADTAEQTKRAAEAAKEHAAALKEEQDAALAMIGGARDLADVNRELWVATLQAKDASEEAAKAKGKDAEANAKAVEQIIKVADLTVKQYEAQIAANGGIVDATKKLDIWNDAALTQAATLRGPARDSLLTYIGQVNQIPPAKLTEIQALLDQGKLTEAKQLIADASKTRTVTLVAQLNTEAFWADYNSIRQRVRNNPIAVPIVPGGRVGFAQGGVARFAQGGVALVGERGPELVGLPDGANVQPTERIRNWLQQNTATINVSAPIGGPGFEREVVKAIRKFQRSNGDLAMGTRH